MNLQSLKCLRCGYEWVPKSLNDPRQCPKCNSRYWNKPKVKQSGLKKESIPEAESCDDDACDADEDGKQYFGDE
jgi:DNA-directed RNA polymerase subunit RPC12/RpoP